MTIKLNKEQTVEVWLALGRGESNAAIARQFGVSSSCIQHHRKIVRGERPHLMRSNAIFKCAGCPLLFLSRNRREFHDPGCRRAFLKRAERERFSEFEWIAGTDSWESVATRLASTLACPMVRWLYRAGQKEWASKVIDSGMPRAYGRAA